MYIVMYTIVHNNAQITNYKLLDVVGHEVVEAEGPLALVAV